MYGQIIAVETRPVATQLLGTHGSGSTVLQVNDVTDFPPSGSVRVGFSAPGTTLAYTSITDTDDPDVPLANPSLALAAPTGLTLAADTLLSLLPVRSYKVALVLIDGEDVVVECHVKHSLFDRLAEGPRAPDTGEVVYVERRHNEMILLIEDVLGRPPTVDARFITPSTLAAAAVNNSDFATTGVIQTVLNSSDSNAMPVQNLRINNGTGATFLVRRDGTGTWDGLETVPPVIAAAILGGSGGIDGGTL